MPRTSRFTLTLWDPYNFSAHNDFWSYAVGQQEICPTTGKLHTQCYGETKDGRRLIATVRKHFMFYKVRCNIELSKGTWEENKVYVSKEASRIENTFFEFGEPKPSEQGQRNDIRLFVDAISTGEDDQSLLSNFPSEFLRYGHMITRVRSLRFQEFRKTQRPMTVEWFHGRPGTGKSRQAFERDEPYDLPLISNGSIWFESYLGANLLILDELRPGIDTALLNKILDRYPLQIPVKGNSTWACWTHVIITSNFHPSAFNSPGLERRCTLKHFDTHIPEIPDDSEDYEEVEETFEDQVSTFFRR